MIVYEILEPVCGLQGGLRREKMSILISKLVLLQLEICDNKAFDKITENK